MGYKRLNIKVAVRILGVNQSDLMGLLKMPTDKRLELKNRIFIVLNGNKYSGHTITGLKAMRDLVVASRDVWRLPKESNKAVKWFNSYKLELDVNYHRHWPIRVIRNNGYVGTMIVVSMLKKISSKKLDRRK